MIPTYCIVPVKNEWRNLTERLLGELLWEDVARVIVLDNGSTDSTAAGVAWLQRNHRRALDGPAFTRLDATGIGIYQMWDDGFRHAARFARKAGVEQWNALFLNNDVSLAQGAVSEMARVLRVYPGAMAAYPDYDAPWGGADHERPDADTLMMDSRETRGVFGDGGMFGPCFMLAGERITWEPLITDASYRWWYGDNHLAECIEQEGGKQVRVVGLPIRHENEGTAQHYPELYDVKLRDRGLWVSRHSRGLCAIDRRA